MTSNVTSMDRLEKNAELRATPARLWRALTDYKECGQWFRVNLEGPFVPGRRTCGHITYPGYEHLKMDVLVQAMEAERSFSFYWHPYAVDPTHDYSKESPTLVEFTLKRTPTGTLLTVTESGFDALPASRRDEAFRMNSGGWDIQMKNLGEYLA